MLHHAGFLLGIVAVVLVLGLAGCGYTPGERALTGGAIGAGLGAGVAGLTGGNMGTGAIIGGAGGALAGAVTAPPQRW
jgi:osmotically inducible lipoprotein OsmB